MRIVHAALRYPPATGGAETYVHELVERTRNIEAKRDIRVLTSKLKSHAELSELSPDELRTDPPYVQRLHHARTPFISYPRLQALSYYLGHHQPDIVHGYSFWYQPADVAARYAKKHNKPFIFHPIYYDNSIRHKWQWLAYKKTLGKKTFALADVVAVISPFERSLIEKAGFPVKRFELLPPGVNVKELQTAKAAPNPFTQRNIKGHILLTVSRLAPGKGLDSIITKLPEILKLFPTVQLVIIGEDFGAQAELETLVQKMNLNNNVNFLGKVSDAELQAAYAHAEIFAHPTHYEAFGIVMAEALAAGTPVVARNVAAVPYIVTHGSSGFLFDNDDELVTAIMTLLQNEELRTQYGQFGQQYVAENFTWDRTINKLLNLYDELL